MLTLSREHGRRIVVFVPSNSGFTTNSGRTILQGVATTDFEIRHLFVSKGHNFVGHHQKVPGTHGMTEVEQITCIAGKGIVGDRYFGFRDNYKGQITFFEQEAHEQLCAQLGVWDCGPEVYRRNVITGGVRLNDLIGMEFEVQGVRFFGREECRPCYWMDFAFSSGAEDALKGRGGLRAEILTNGHLRRTSA
jgi:MOSC domain-containing protein YiiM